MPYIDWAISHGFGVIDVNVPMFVAPLEVSLFVASLTVILATYFIRMWTRHTWRSIQKTR
jgi:hypothetical protein